MRLTPIRVAAAYLLAALSAGCAAPARTAQDAHPVQDAHVAQTAPTPQDSLELQSDADKGVGHALLLYVPNRVFDLLDIARARLRVGPGFGVSFRATRLAAAEIGSWSTVFVGLHGPRLKPEIPWPFGYDRSTGIGVSVESPGTDENVYGRAEFGFGAQLAIVGFDLGVDPVEAVDFLTGLVFVDIEGDDF